MIKIRKAKKGDEEGISEVSKIGLNSGSWKFTNTIKYQKNWKKQLHELFRNKKPERYFFVAIDTKENKIVGNLLYSFNRKGRIRHRIGLGWGIHPDYVNKGIGTKLLKFALKDAKKRGFKRAEAEMAVKNAPSWKIALKCGFKIEGTKKKGMVTDEGKYIDMYIVGKIL